MADGREAAWGEGQTGGGGPERGAAPAPGQEHARRSPPSLPELAAALGLPAAGLPDVPVRGVTHNADWITPGDLFVAIRGARFDGHAFIPRAAERGAVAVLGEGLGEGLGDAPGAGRPYLTVPHARQALADAAAVLAGFPSRFLRVVGVTGTDGKTTTTWLTRWLLRAAGMATGMISSVGYELPDGELRQFPAHFTTPEAPQVQATLGEMRAAGAGAAVLEASSHGLALDRVRGVEWDVGVWTHLSSEHLEFHGTLDNYFADKRRLIERSPFAVLNADDSWTARLRGVARAETTYSVGGHAADWQAQDVREAATGLRFRVVFPGGEFEAALPVVGRFNVANALAASAAAHHLGATPEQLQAGLASFAGVPGRLQEVRSGDGASPRVIIDSAHTPVSLEGTLRTLRPRTPGRLWVVIGSAGGRRDPYKRAPLGEVATRLADLAIFTEADHRETPLAEILGEMERGAREAGHTNFLSIGDRAEAIRHVISEAAPGDTVVIANKGVEDTLERGADTLPWSDLAQARAALRERAERSG